MSQEVTVTPIQQVTREPTWVRWLLIGTAIIVGLGLTRFWLTMILAVAVYIASLIHSAIVTRLGRRG